MSQHCHCESFGDAGDKLREAIPDTTEIASGFPTRNHFEQALPGDAEFPTLPRCDWELRTVPSYAKIDHSRQMLI